MDVARLKTIKLFSSLSERDLAMIAAWATETSVPAGEVLMRESDFSYDVLGILDGTVEVRHGGTVVAELGPGEIVGEIGCLRRDRRSATVIATSPLMLVRLTSWDVRHLERDAPAVVEAIRDLAEDRLALAA